LKEATSRALPLENTECGIVLEQYNLTGVALKNIEYLNKAALLALLLRVFGYSIHEAA